MQNIHTHTCSMYQRQCRCLRVHFVTALTLSEMHNTEEASHIVGVMGVCEVSLTLQCCGLCSWRF